MAPASIINFLSKEDTPRLAAGFFIADNLPVLAGKKPIKKGNPTQFGR